MSRIKPLHPVIENKIRELEAAASSRYREVRLSGNAEKAPCGFGFLTMITTDRYTGAIKEIQSGSNMVVNLGRSGLAHLLAGDGVDSHKVVAMQFGSGSVAPTVSDTSLSGPQIIQKSTAFSFPDGDGGLKVTFTAVVGADEGNGSGSQTYNEACLVKGNGEIFSRKVSGAITKDNTVVLTAIYTLIF